jgi:hypothetical protein
MHSSPAQDRLAAALAELTRSKGIELPRIPESSGRAAYLCFLATMGYGEAELLPVIQRDKVTAEMHGALLAALMQAAQSDDKKLVMAVIWMAHNTILGRDNTNLIINELATTLAADLKKTQITVPPFYAGVFPTDSYNAQCKVFNGERLILIDTGCMEMAEAIVIAFLSKMEPGDKVEEISSAVDRYVLQGKRADGTTFNTEGIDFGSGLVAHLTNAFEEFIVAHELGHLTLGHCEDQQIRHLQPRKGVSVDVTDKTEQQEFQADMWACQALIHSARSRHRSDSDLPLAVGGISMGIGVGLLVEASAKKHGVQLPPGHPPTLERLYMLEVAFELFGAHADAYVARRFRELLEQVVAEKYRNAEMPPMLDRDLNKKLMPVLDSLGIDYSGASYIRDFA